ncbi:MAG: translation initiation factor IF-1 [Candidatus Yanofskybacteria bacterium RIFCSPLOWO2_02_FULL_47_9b]|uniref:Translation initiation factor IF-1 n=1 Tax=Candidatus Yanofskybacteria bacterium RIFCSPLOWO2_02_FULL_47_9b TaxID=1802708 RepID=A0A1F8H5C4_9BACT|nr:MAG: translation initiation factor IF-1 [Candidatus Yanofskybacteria bacterium RIFCSPLOWO2_02_FULL_47_9b]
MPSEANLQKEKRNGVIIEALPDTKFKVQLEDGREVLAYLAGKMRMNYIKVMIGDRVTVELSPDGAKGRITYRN